MTLQFNNVMLEQTLAAVPLFIFMGILMEQAGLMERLFRAVQLVLSSTRGALYIAVLFVSTIFAAATGIVGASVTILGIMAAKTMNRSGYDVKLAAGTITAGGTLGILIPPVDHAGGHGAGAGGAGHRSLRRGHRPRHPAGLPVHRLFADPVLAEPRARPAAAGGRAPGDLRVDVAGVRRRIVVPVALFLGVTAAVHAFVAPAIPGEGLLSRMLGLVAYLAAYAALARAMIAAHRWLDANRPAASTSARCGPSSTWGWCPPPCWWRSLWARSLLGWATPTEARPAARFGALLMTLGYGKMTPAKFQGGPGQDPGNLGADPVPGRGVNFFGAVFSRLGTPTMLTNACWRSTSPRSRS